VQDDRTFSSKLFKKMRIEKCGGDFCNYVMLEKSKGPLAIRQGLKEEYQKSFTETKNTKLDNL
jgi:hypothetical protein